LQTTLSCGSQVISTVDSIWLVA